jgi:hypothetical protein
MTNHSNQKRSKRSTLRTLPALLLPAAMFGSAACVGLIGDTDGKGDEENEGIGADALARIGPSGMRRLTIREYNDTVRDLLGDTTSPATQWFPQDDLSPFDNDFTHQKASAVLIEGAETVASEIAARFISDPALREEVVGCTPEEPGDEACFRHFIETFGRRAFRRPLDEAEIEGFMPLLSLATAGTDVVPTDFYTAVETALRAFLQHPKFLYRIEIGTPVEGQDGVFALDDWEKATRLSYLLWGSTPSDELLDKVASGQLADPDLVRAAASEMLTDPRALERIDRFHALWFGYDTLPLDGTLTAAMRKETQALVERVVFEEQLPWTQMLLSTETYVDATLAEHYGLELPADGSGWVSYGDSGRQGLLSHGSYLSANVQGADTSPTMRGLFVRTRLFCQDIPPPPETVNKDDLPESDSPCKKDVRAVYMTGSCAGCHTQMDPIGYGLEAYDAQGRFRTHEPDHPECTIDGKGTIDGIGDFEGPAGLANLAVQSEDIQTCVTTMLYRFAMGRYELESSDRAFIDMLVDNADAIDAMRFDDLVLSFVGAEEFGYRVEEPALEDPPETEEP